MLLSRRDLLIHSGVLLGGSSVCGVRSASAQGTAAVKATAVTDGAGFSDPYHLEIHKARRIQIDYKLDFTRAAGDVAAWMIYVSQPPQSPGQPDADLSVRIPGSSLRAIRRTDLAPLKRKFQTIWAVVADETRRSQLTVEAVLTATMQSRRLAPGAPITLVPPLPVLYAREYTKPTRFYDFETPAIAAWIRENALVKRHNETTLSFAYRAFRAVQDNVVYGFPTGEDVVGTFRASSVAKQRHGDCLGSNVLFGSVLRANKIPYRNMGGRWSFSNKIYKESENNHSRSEFWCDGIGWVPVDATAPGPKGATRDEIESKFGSDTGDFFAIHEDLDYVIPVLNHPSLTLGWFHYYVVVYGAEGNPLANGADVKQTWSIRETSSE